MFPVTVFYQLYSLADFSPLGYSTNISDSIGKMSSQLLETFNNGAGTNAATEIIISGTITVTLPAKLNPALNLLVAKVSSPDVHTRFTRTGYTPATPSLAGTVVYNGSVTGTWTISPYIPLQVPVLISQGGSGVSAAAYEGKTVKQELGIDYPSFSMNRIFDDFTSSVVEAATDPWFLVKKTSGTATAVISTVPLYGNSGPGLTATDCYLGLLKLTTKGSEATVLIDDRGSTEGSIFFSYGQRAFMQPLSGGPIHFKTRVKPQAVFTTTDVSRMQIGLKGDLGARGVNFLNHYGLGFEVWSLANSQVITVICAVPGKINTVPTGIAFDTSRFFDLEIKISPFDKKARFYVNSELFHTEDLTYWPEKETLLHPAVSHSTSTLTERSIFVDYIYTTQKVNRG